MVGPVWSHFLAPQSAFPPERTVAMGSITGSVRLQPPGTLPSPGYNPDSSETGPRVGLNQGACFTPWQSRKLADIRRWPRRAAVDAARRSLPACGGGPLMKLRFVRFASTLLLVSLCLA